MRSDMRLHYVDWLRVSAFAVLILYHSSVAFFPDMEWLIASAERSASLQMVMDHPRAWRLALLFFVSGMGSWFVFRSRAGSAFLSERVSRLLLPLLFAMAVIVVPQVWYERAYYEGYEGSLGTFWLTRYFTEGKYPEGNITWAHMWFVGYLLAMTIVCYPVFRLLKHSRLKPLNDWFARRAASPWVYMFFLLPVVLNLVLSPFFPRQTNALYNDGAWFAVWASWFGLGFLFAKHHAAIIGGVIERRWTSAAVMLLVSGLLYGTAWSGEPSSMGSWTNMTALYKIAIMALAWSMILTLLGFGAKHLNRRSAALSWVSGKVFPLYIVHQTVIVAVLFHVLPLDLPLWGKYLTVLSSTVVLSLAFAVAAERLPWPLRALFGLGDNGTRIRIPEPAREVSTHR